MTTEKDQKGKRQGQFTASISSRAACKSLWAPAEMSSHCSARDKPPVVHLEAALPMTGSGHVPSDQEGASGHPGLFSGINYIE